MGELIERERKDIQVQSANEPVNPMQLVSMAVEQGADIEKLSKLMDLQERWEAGQAKKAFDEAINEFQSRMPVVPKRGNVSYQPRNGGQATNYDYGRIEDAFRTAAPILKETGLSFRFRQEAQQGGMINVTCIISHKLGHHEENSMCAMPDTSGNKDAIKAMASTVSYLRRYTFTGGLGIIFAGEDDESQLTQSEPMIIDAESVIVELVREQGKDDKQLFEWLSKSFKREIQCFDDMTEEEKQFIARKLEGKR